MAGSEEDAALAAALKRSVEERNREEELLNQALQESLQIQPSNEQEDPQLARALAESKQDMERQQAALLAEYENARGSSVNGDSNKIPANSNLATEAEYDPVLSAGLEASRESFEVQQAMILAAYERLGDKRDIRTGSARGEMVGPGLVSESPALRNEGATEARRRNGNHVLTHADGVALAMDRGRSPGSSSSPPRPLSHLSHSANSSRAGASSAAKLPDTDAALARRSTVTQSSIKPGVSVDGEWLRGKRLKMVVIDGQNVACELGGSRNSFSSKAIKIALDFYQKRHFHAVAIVPRHRIDARPQNERNVADNVPLLLSLNKDGRVFFSPASCHDDYFILQYAMQNNAYVVSNDRFREMPDLQTDQENAQRVRSFIENMRVPFMFVDEQFFPSPAAGKLGM